MSSYRKSLWIFTRKMSGSGPDACKVCILGGCGGIGRHLALFLKLNKLITDLTLYDLSNTNGVREDLSHIDTSCRVEAVTGSDPSNLKEAVKCSNLVVILAGQAHSPKFPTREHMFDANAQLMVNFMKAIVETNSSKMPFINVVTNPVNTLVPLCGEYLKQIGCFDKRKLFGSTTIDVIRARTFLGQLLDCDPSKLNVPVIGGHSGGSITPLVSQSKPHFDLEPKVQQKLEDRIINGGTEVVDAKEHHGAAQLSLGYAISKFCNSICRAIHGEKNVVEAAYIPADINELEYFACYFDMDENGVKKLHRLPPMSDYEQILYKKAIKDVQANIDKAKAFLSNLKNKKT